MTEPREKIEKLLRLAESDNAGEAAAALSKARLLMEKYGFSETDFLVSDDSIQTPFEAEVFRILREFMTEKEAREFIRSHAFINPLPEYRTGVLDGLSEALSVVYSDSDLFSHEKASDSLFIDDDDLFECGKSAWKMNDLFEDKQYDCLFETQGEFRSLFEDMPEETTEGKLWKAGHDEAYNSVYAFLKK